MPLEVGLAKIDQVLWRVCWFSMENLGINMTAELLNTYLVEA